MEINVKEVNNKLIDQYIKEIAFDNHDAFENLYHLTSKKTFGFILSILKNKHDAEDVLHDTYVSIYHASKKYQSNGRAYSWILGIARNLSLLKLRENRKEVSVAYEDFEEDIDYQKDISVEEKLMIREFMEILNEEEREIVYLHTIAGFKHREIAQLMNLGLATVLSKYHRAIKKLRNKIEKEII